MFGYTLAWRAHVVGNCSILISILDSHSVQMKDDIRNEWQAAGISLVRESLLTFPTCTTDRSFLWEEVMEILHDAFNPDDHYVCMCEHS